MKASASKESLVEQAALAWFEALGYELVEGRDLQPDNLDSGRTKYSDVVLADRLFSALVNINRNLPSEALDEAMRQVLNIQGQSLVQDNRRFHKFLIHGVPVVYQENGHSVNGHVQLADFEQPKKNSWLVVHQFIVYENAQCRPDIVVFLNGLPIAVFELKNIVGENSGLESLYSQLKTYERDVPSLLTYNEALVISNGLNARIGTLTDSYEQFMPWRILYGKDLDLSGASEMEIMIRGVFRPENFLDLIYHFNVFESYGETTTKKMARYHQYRAVNKAIEATVHATSNREDKRAGLVWHTQGSGKSLTMTFYAGKLISHPSFKDSILVVLSDRNDIDNQLFYTFSRCKELLSKEPIQAQSIADLKAKIEAASEAATRSVIFTTVHKLLAILRNSDNEVISQRGNIIFIVDEAHASYYDLSARIFKGGDSNIEEKLDNQDFTRSLRSFLPNATFIGFTSKPVDTDDATTKEIFGDYIDLYTMESAIEDGATLPIYYESRLSKISPDSIQWAHENSDFVAMLEGEEINVRESVIEQWSSLTHLIGSSERLSLIASDIVEHFEKHDAAINGKGMIACMSRNICVHLYEK